MYKELKFSPICDISHKNKHRNSTEMRGDPVLTEPCENLTSTYVKQLITEKFLSLWEDRFKNSSNVESTDINSKDIG